MYVAHSTFLPHPGDDGQRLLRRWSIDSVTMSMLMDVVDDCFVQEGTITQSMDEFIQLSQKIDKADVNSTSKTHRRRLLRRRRVTIVVVQALCTPVCCNAVGVGGDMESSRYNLNCTLLDNAAESAHVPFPAEAPISPPM